MIYKVIPIFGKMSRIISLSASSKRIQDGGT